MVIFSFQSGSYSDDYHTANDRFTSSSDNSLYKSQVAPPSYDQATHGYTYKEPHWPWTQTHHCFRFLAHLSQRLKWAIVIAHRPSSVRPSSVRPSVVRPSVNFHIFNFFSRTPWWILMKLGRDEVLMVPYKCCCFSDRSAQGRIQGGAKIGHGGSPSSRIFFFRPEGYSNKPNG